MKILTILGARPQFIKAGSVSREIAKHSDINEVIVHTGQHYDSNMSDIFFSQMAIKKPNYFLGIGGKSHGAMTGQMIEKIEEVTIKEKPDILMVYGDTNSTLAGAIVASKIHIPLVHIESGLRSFNMNMPEEVNRILTDRVSSYLFTPTQAAMDNLTKEGYPFIIYDKKQVIKCVGDVMQDGAVYYKSLAKKPNIKANLEYGQYILCTIHRAENTDNIERLKAILEALQEISKSVEVIIPLHPRTKSIIDKEQLKTDGIHIIEPMGYLEMVYLIDNAGLVMSDSGGLQKEAYFFNKPCITLREETEWVELVECGANVLSGANKTRILDAFNKSWGKHIATDLHLYGDGNASEKIIKEILNG